MRRSGRSFTALTMAGLLVMPVFALPAMADSDPQLNFKIYNPDTSFLGPIGETGEATGESTETSEPVAPADSVDEPKEEASLLKEEVPQLDDSTPSTEEASKTASESADTADSADGQKVTKRLQGYVRVVPTGTKIPIILDTAIDSDTSQEADEFSARTSEDLSIDGSTVIPAGSIIKGRIAQLNSPRHLNRSGSVALKFDTITTPDNRQIPIVANLVARGGVVHARRGLKDIAIDTGAVAIPTAVGIGIGALAGGTSSSSSSSSSGIGRGGAAMIGAGVGLAVGVAILLSKKGKKIDVRPGDELKIQLAEDLRMPMM